MYDTYTLSFTAVAVTAQQDLFEITAAAAGAVEILEIHLSQSTEIGDAMEEGLSIVVKSGATSSGTGGSQAVVPVPLGASAAFGGVCDTNNTTPASGGTIVTHFPFNWNVRVPFDQYFPPDARKVLAPSARLVVSLLTTPGDSITMSGYVVFREIG